MKKKILSVTIGIPTVHAGEHLLKTIASIQKQTFLSPVIEVVVDGGKPKKQHLKQLKRWKVNVTIEKKQKGQSARINTLLEKSTADLLVLTNDDVILHPKAIEKIIVEYQREQSDLICVNVFPLTPKSVTEYFLQAGTQIRSILCEQQKQPHYLMCNGRCLVISKRMQKKLSIPEFIWNNDAFMFFFAKKNSFKISYIKEPLCFFRDPNNKEEYFKQTQKFQYSYKELQSVFHISKNEYAVSKRMKFYAFVSVFFRDPIKMIGYVYLYLWSRIQAKRSSLSIHQTFWSTDKTTKQI